MSMSFPAAPNRTDFQKAMVPWLGSGGIRVVFCEMKRHRDETQTAGETEIITKPLPFTVVESCFLAACSQLIEFDTKGMTEVTSIKDYFLQGCKNLASLNTRGLVNVKALGARFLEGCSSLTAIDTNGFAGVLEINTAFMQQCTSLTAIDTSGFRRLQKTGDWFLSGCSNLTSANLEGLSNVTVVGYRFMASCTKLTSIDVSSLSKVSRVENDIFMGCTSLRSIVVARGNISASDIVIRKCGTALPVYLPPPPLLTALAFVDLLGPVLGGDDSPCDPTPDLLMSVCAFVGAPVEVGPRTVAQEFSVVHQHLFIEEDQKFSNFIVRF